MRSAMETLSLDSLDVIHAGAGRYELATGVRALPASQLTASLKPLARRLLSQ